MSLRNRMLGIWWEGGVRWNMSEYSASVGGRVSVRVFGIDMRWPEFPERPGALGGFLKGMKPYWNISLFHYRNHGSGVSPSLPDCHPAETVEMSARCW